MRREQSNDGKKKQSILRERERERERLDSDARVWDRVFEVRSTGLGF